MRMGHSIFLSSFASGLDRSGPEADRNAAAEATNVWNPNGYVRRRPSYTSLAGGPVWMRPAGSALFFYGSGATPTNVSTRLIDYSFLTAGTWMYLRAATPFDGFEINDLTVAAYGATSQKKLVFQYSKSPNLWEDLPWFLDKTMIYGSGVAYAEPFGQIGRVHWHAPDDWGSRVLGTSLGTTSGYFVRFKFVSSADGSDVAPENQFALKAPGFMIFDRHPINGLFHAPVGNRQGVISFADRPDNYGAVGGANVGGCFDNDTSELNLRTRRSTGIWDVVSYPQPLAPGGSPTTTTSGTAGEITDTGRGLANEGPIDAAGLYLQRRPYGIVFTDDVTANGGTLSTTVITTTDARVIAMLDGDLEHFIAEVKTQGSSALTAGTHRLIRSFTVSGGIATITVESAFASAPASDTVFKILRPPALVYIEEAGKAYHLGALSAASNRLVPENASYRRAVSNYASNARIHFEIHDEFRFTVARGSRWQAAFDEITRELVFINGGRPFTFNGLSIEPLRAADADSPVLQNLLGQIANIGPEAFGLKTAMDYRQQFRAQPPAGKFIVSYGGRLVIADDHAIYWGLPHDANNIWPRTYEALVRDARGGSITGLAVLYDRLIVSTKTGIFEGQLVDGVGINLRPVSGGVGFMSQSAMCNIAIGQQDALIGPAADGLIIYAANEPIYAIDNWEKVIPGGISDTALDDACGAVLRQAGLYIMAFSPKVGGTIGNTHLLVYDYVKKASWVWTVPWGVSSLATATGAGGREYLLIGTDDGFIQTLTDTDLDDNVEPIEWAIETNDVAPAGAMLVKPTRVHITAAAMPAASAPTVKVRMRGSRRDWLSGTTQFDLGEATWNVTSWDDDPLWPQMGDKTAIAGVPWGAKASSFRFRMEGTGKLELKAIEVELESGPKGDR